MTLLIAYLLMAQMGADGWWYPLVFILWVLHLIFWDASTEKSEK